LAIAITTQLWRANSQLSIAIDFPANISQLIKRKICEQSLGVSAVPQKECVYKYIAGQDKMRTDFRIPVPPQIPRFLLFLLGVDRSKDG